MLLSPSFSRLAVADSYIVTLDPAARSEPATGRIILFFITRTDPKKDLRWFAIDPIEGPFFDAPQPIASVAVKDFKPGESITIDGSTSAFPQSLDKLAGQVRVQAVLDADQTERSHDAGPGNVFSDVQTVDVAPQKDETIKITLTHRVEPKPREDSPNLKWVRLRSELLSKFYGRDVYLRAGVALPKHYDDPNWPRQQWPAFYVIPGFGGRDDMAVNYRNMLLARGVEEIAPIAVYIVLDPEAPLGHHSFADSANNGPRATALVTELIPYLEKNFRIIARPEARIVTGHSSGGWASLWLQLNYPNVFGACWSSAPDPIDFSAFQAGDIYNMANMFTDAEGKDVPSYRNIVDATLVPKPLMTVRQETAMEIAIDPDGRSGQQWSAWNAVFSPRDDKTGLPAPMFDMKTGVINKSIVQEWEKYDISKLVRAHWDEMKPVVLGKVHLACGEADSYFLNRAVERFGKMVDELRGDTPWDGGYVLLVPHATHDNLTELITMRWNNEERSYLLQHGFQDPFVPEKQSACARIEDRVFSQFQPISR
jgi:hypothetical protein